ncbi:MAG: UvrD/REP helicase [Firmicutes bacterium]|nr:UvrD/REP helicase [Bacillota bacterium]
MSVDKTLIKPTVKIVVLRHILSLLIVKKSLMWYNLSLMIEEGSGEDMLEISLQNRFCAARRRAISLEFPRLNPQQAEGVLTTQGPLLLLAGAGSGKTTVLINRVTNLLRYGSGSDSETVPQWVTEEDLRFLESWQGVHGRTPQEVIRMEELCTLDPVRPWEIIAITFTNKAAGELKARLEAAVGPAGREVWASTFHAACMRILRREIEVLGYPSSFTIYDTDDSLRVIKACLRELNMDEKTFQPRAVLSHISRAKDELLLPGDYEDRCRAAGDYRLMRIAGVYAAYSKKLESAGALDFDDIILHTVRIFQQFPQIRGYYQKRFRYVLVDEYQDTNHLQYLLAKFLAGGHRNLCVVGDDDQSIYRFRGATIENILSFEEEYPDARVIRLEQNYRSTKYILEASNAVIGNNSGRKGKTLWTEQEGGGKVQAYQSVNEQDEAIHVADEILKGFTTGRSWKDFAVLYRMNAQSNQLEMAFKRNSIPYRVIGGFRFFERAEIKDMLAYLCVIQNPADDLRLLRIVNNPPRGIGARTVEIAQQIAQEEGLPLWEIIRHADRFAPLQKSAVKLRTFVEMMEGLMIKAEFLSLTELYDALLLSSGYVTMLEEKREENATRLENVRELKSSIIGYLENTDEPTLAGFLDEVALYTDWDSQEDADNSVTMMTMHAAKGLEFPVVFAVGLEEGIFPGFRAIGEHDELEEERRLCYVAMTRAKEELYLSWAASRMLFGKTASYMPSRFVKEIPPEYVETTGRTPYDHNDLPFEDQWKKPSLNAYGGEGAAGLRQIPGGIPQQTVYRSPAKKGTALPEFAKGEMVHHDAFGKGMLISVQPMGGDALIEVAFDNVGTKRLMLKAAAQHMRKL